MSNWPQLYDDALADLMGHLGVVVVYQHLTPTPGAPYDLEAVFDAEHEAVRMDTGGEVDISTQQPVLGVRLAAMQAAPKQDDLVTYAGKTYRVSDVRRDGQGGASLALKVKL